MEKNAQKLLARELILHNCKDFEEYTQKSGMLTLRQYNITPGEIHDEIKNLEGLYKQPEFLYDNDLLLLFRNEYKNAGSTSIDDFIMNASIDSIHKLGDYGVSYEFAQYTLQHIDDQMESPMVPQLAYRFIEVGAIDFEDYQKKTGEELHFDWEASNLEVANLFDDIHEYEYLREIQPTIKELTNNPILSDVVVRDLNRIESRMNELDARYNLKSVFEERDFAKAIQNTPDQLTL